MVKIKKYKLKKTLYDVKKMSVSSTDVESDEKGSADNPYTLEEFNALLDNDEWEGGYVVGFGYVAPVVDIHGSTVYGSDEYSDEFFSWPWGSGSALVWPSDLFGSNYEEENNGGNGNNNNGGNNSGNNTGNSSNSYNSYPQGTKLFNNLAFDWEPFDGVGIRATFFYSGSMTIEGRLMTLYAEIVNPQPDFTYSGVLSLYINGKKFSSVTMSNPGTSYIQHGHVAIGKCSIELPKYGKVKAVLDVIIEMGNLAGHYFGSRSITIYQN